MAQFTFLQWLIDWLESQIDFVFIWDDGNKSKSLEKHGVDLHEAEEVFLNSDKTIALGVQHAPEVNEPRFGVLGTTHEQRLLFVSFTIRGSGVRVISARPMNKKERKLYGKITS
jgi:uncharacterized DUF497 family protein